MPNMQCFQSKIESTTTQCICIHLRRLQTSVGFTKCRAIATTNEIIASCVHFLCGLRGFEFQLFLFIRRGVNRLCNAHRTRSQIIANGITIQDGSIASSDRFINVLFTAEGSWLTVEVRRSLEIAASSCTAGTGIYVHLIVDEALNETRDLMILRYGPRNTKYFLSNCSIERESSEC